MYSWFLVRWYSSGTVAGTLPYMFMYCNVYDVRSKRSNSKENRIADRRGIVYRVRGTDRDGAVTKRVRPERRRESLKER